MSVPAAVTPGVILKSRFVTSDKNEFEDYVEYIDREEANKDKKLSNAMFSLYQDYMDDPDKTSFLFTERSNRLTLEEKKQLKNLFEKAQKNNSIMWQDVISFDNKWLEEHGLYDTGTHTLDEKKIMDVTRQAMSEMFTKENLEKSAIWSAAIHYNTDNIHIHAATVEPFPTRKRGKRKPKTLDAMKSKVVNNIMDRSVEHKKINDLIRKNMVEKKKHDSTLKWRNRKLKPLFIQVYKQLPEDKKQWHYSYHTLNSIKPSIDELSRSYIEKYHKKDYELFLKKLDQEVDVLKRAYGEGPLDKKRYENYKQNKIDDLYKRMGNAFLKEMKEYDKEQRELNKRSRRSNTKFSRFKRNLSIQYTMKKIERAFENEYDSWKNQRAYEKLQKQIEQQNLEKE